MQGLKDMTPKSMASCSAPPPFSAGSPQQKDAPICAEQIFSRFKDATVNIRAIPKYKAIGCLSKVTGSRATATATPVTVGDAVYTTEKISTIDTFSLLEAGILPASYSGFFVERGFLVSTSGFLNVLFLSLFLSLIVHFGKESVTTVPTLPAKSIYDSLRTTLEMFESVSKGMSSFADWFDFYVEVFNVNGCGMSYIYKGFVLGADTQTGVAVYKIDECDPWNKCLPKIQQQPCLRWGNSKCCHPGNKVYTIADFNTSDSQSLSSGSVISNVNASRDGAVTYEMMVTTMDVALGASGAPILNECGYVVGVITGLTNRGRNAVGVSSSFIEKIVTCLIQDACKPGCSPHAYYSPLFGFILYRHGTVDWSYRVKTADDLHQLLVRARINEELTPDPADSSCCGDHYRPKMLEALFYSGEYCKMNRGLLGLVMTCKPRGSLEDAIEQCRRAAPIFNKDCCDIYQIEKGDVVTHINGVPLGQLGTQTTPDNLFKCLLPCDPVNFTFYKEDEMWANCHELCSELDDSLCWLSGFPGMYPVATTGSPPKEVPAPYTGANIAKWQQWFVCVFKWSLNFLDQVTASTFLSNMHDRMHITFDALDLLANGGQSITSLITSPSTESTIRPAVYLDTTQSLPHSAKLCAYENVTQIDVQGLATVTPTGGTAANEYPGVTDPLLLNLLVTMNILPHGSANMGGKQGAAAVLLAQVAHDVSGVGELMTATMAAKSLYQEGEGMKVFF